MVEWSGPAKKDLKQIHDYIAQDSKYYAKNVVQNIVEKSETLELFPKVGRIVPEINDPSKNPGTSDLKTQGKGKENNHFAGSTEMFRPQGRQTNDR